MPFFSRKQVRIMFFFFNFDIQFTWGAPSREHNSLIFLRNRQCSPGGYPVENTTPILLVLKGNEPLMSRISLDFFLFFGFTEMKPNWESNLKNCPLLLQAKLNCISKLKKKPFFWLACGWKRASPETAVPLLEALGPPVGRTLVSYGFLFSLLHSDKLFLVPRYGIYWV